MVKTKQTRIHFETYDGSIASGVNLGFGEKGTFNSLHDIVESLTTGVDGQVAECNQILCTVRATGPTEFGMIAILAQTAGAVADVTNSASRTVAEILDAMSDDVIGYEALSNYKISKRLPTQAAATDHFGLEFTVAIPRKFLNLLNKEAETERLQELYILLIGEGNVEISINYSFSYEIRYILRAKGIAIR